MKKPVAEIDLSISTDQVCFIIIKVIVIMVPMGRKSQKCAAVREPSLWMRVEAAAADGEIYLVRVTKRSCVAVVEKKRMGRTVAVVGVY